MALPPPPAQLSDFGSVGRAARLSLTCEQEYRSRPPLSHGVTFPGGISVFVWSRRGGGVSGTGEPKAEIGKNQLFFDFVMKLLYAEQKK